jgi:hypothetical protein
MEKATSPINATSVVSGGIGKRKHMIGQHVNTARVEVSVESQIAKATCHCMKVSVNSH